ncbi:hypothetical protein FB451DRAFT_1392987 [Mycena latifolia]|nr:hypothetical protein FB451DRAFT_1392987 [Mycena latifolia]
MVTNAATFSSFGDHLYFDWFRVSQSRKVRRGLLGVIPFMFLINLNLSGAVMSGL